MTHGRQCPNLPPSYRALPAADGFGHVPEPVGLSQHLSSRVLPRGDDAEVVFTQFQAPGMPDEVFAQNVATITQELEVLKSACEDRTR